MDGQIAFLAACHTQFPVVMNDIFQDVTEILKIGEGIFGEVYEGKVPLISPGQEGRGDQNQSTKVVFKVVPIQGEEKVNGERQKRFEEVIPEIVITEKLGELVVNKGEGFPHASPGFIQMYAAYLGIGEYPPNLISAWKAYDETYDSDNDVPEFACDQKYMVLLFEFGGADAGQYQYVDARQTFFMLMQTIHIIAVGEAALEFEHRDLHGNNILIKSSLSDFNEFKLNGKILRVPTFGIVPTIIDFTMSRIKHPETNADTYYDMADDDELFMSKGDYQFDIYRMMKDENRNNWAPFTPKTNIMWVHYLTDKFLRKGTYSLVDTDQHKFYLRRMELLKSRLLTFPSCQAFVSSQLCAKLLLPPTDHKRKFVNRGRVGSPISKKINKPRSRN